MKLKRLIFPIIALILAVSCGGEEFDPALETPGASPTPEAPAASPTATAPAPTETPEPTTTPETSATRLPHPLDTPFSLHVGQSERVGDLEITLAGITEDSRCPPDVQCVWQGQVGVQLEVTAAGGEMEPLTLTSVMSPTIALPAHQITLVSVEPGPAEAGSSIPPAEYVVTLQVAEPDEP